MDRTGTKIQLNPPLQPPTITAQAPQVHFYGYTNIPNYFYDHYSQSQNPNPFPDHHHFTTLSAKESQPVPPGVDPVQSVAVNPTASTGNGDSQRGLTYSSSLTVGLPSAVAHVDFQDPNQIVALIPCRVNLYGAGVTVPSTAIQNGVSANPDSVLRINQTIGSRRRNTLKKASKKIKIVQSVWCEVCGIDCNSKDVLDKHKLGKKHKKNLEKLISANKCVLPHTPLSASIPPPAATVSNNPVIGPQEQHVKANCASSQIAQKKAAGSDDLVTKRKRVLEGGAAAGAVRTCAICNVVCNSDIVFRFHLQGQKHATKVKQHSNATRLATVT